MDGILDSKIESIQASGYKAALVVAGGGVGAVQALMVHPGASRFVLETQMPYTPRAMFDYLGEKLESFCSEEAAETMAQRAYERAMVFTLPGGMTVPILGIACTAALQTTRERKGGDRAWFCIKSKRKIVSHKLDLEYGNREEQDAIVGDALLDFVARFLEETP